MCNQPLNNFITHTGKASWNPYSVQVSFPDQR